MPFLLVLIPTFFLCAQLAQYILETLFGVLEAVLKGIFGIISWIFNGFSLHASRREQERILTQQEKYRQAELQRRRELRAAAHARRQEQSRIADERRQRLLKEASDQGREELRNLNQMMLQLDQTTRKLQRRKAGTDEILRLRQQMYDLESQKMEIVKRLNHTGFPPPRDLIQSPIPASSGCSTGRKPKSPPSCKQNHGFLMRGC